MHKILPKIDGIYCGLSILSIILIPEGIKLTSLEIYSSKNVSKIKRTAGNILNPQEDI